MVCFESDVQITDRTVQDYLTTRSLWKLYLCCLCL